MQHLIKKPTKVSTKTSIKNTDLNHSTQQTTQASLSQHALKCMGFTLLELLITVSLLSIILTSGTPQLAKALDNARNKAQGSQLQESLGLARSFAIAHLVDVVICPAQNEQKMQCKDKTQSNENWSFGWLVFADQNRDGQLNNDERILQSLPLVRGQAVVFNQNGRLRFFADGRARSAGFYVCNVSQSSERYIRLLHTGRTRISNELSEIQASQCQATINT